MQITRDTIVEKLTAYLHHQITLEELVDWAECMMMDGEFDEDQFEILRDVVSKLGLADVRAFGLTWEDCKQMLNSLGYTTHVEILAA